MQNLILKTVFLICALISSSSVTRGQYADPPLNSIDIRQIAVKNGLNHVFYFGDSPDALWKAFGKSEIKKPKDKSDVSEVTGLYCYSYIYDGLEVSFEKDELEGVNFTNNSITISNSKYSLFLNGIAYKVGDTMMKLKSSFPDSFKNSEVNPDPDRQQMFIGINDTDANVCVEYNKKGIITELWVGVNES